MEEAGVETISGTDPRNRRAAWWCWPLIVFALLPYERIIPYFLSTGQKQTVEKKVEVSPGSADWSLLKFQSEVLVGYDSLGELASFPAAAGPGDEEIGKQLDTLVEQTEGDRRLAALILLDQFLDLERDEDSASSVQSRLEEIEDGELRTLTGRALEGGLDEEGREKLRSFVGWFADLAPAEGGGESPNETQVRSKAVVVLVVLTGVVLLGFCFLVIGACLLVYFVSTVTRGKRATAFQPAGRKNGYLFEAFSLYLGLMTLGALVGAVAGFFVGVFVGNAIMIAGHAVSVVVALLWPRIRGVSWRDFRQSIGWHRGKGWLREIGAGVIGYMGLLSVASIGIMLTGVLSYFGQKYLGGEVGPEPHPIIGWIDEGGFLAKIACLFLAAGFAPFFEETFFRGAFHRYLRERMRFIWAALLAGVIFAALHPQGLFGIPALASMGIGFALIREWRDSLVAPMVAHAINNGVLVGLTWFLL